MAIKPHLSLRIVFPSSRDYQDVLLENIRKTSASGVHILYDALSSDPEWPYVAASSEDRIASYLGGLYEVQSSAVMCARGGYGASDLLPLIPWQQLETKAFKWIVGFSDVTALLCANFFKLGWKGVHGPMMGSALWDEDSNAVKVLLEFLSGSRKCFSQPVKPLTTHAAGSPEGILIGGCMSVLCSQIGTPYLPSNVDGYILFLEDVGENPGKIMRMWNQMLQSGFVKDPAALVLGRFTELSDPSEEILVKERIAKLSPFPVYELPTLGHIRENHPIIIGARGSISEGQLQWHL